MDVSCPQTCTQRTAHPHRTGTGSLDVSQIGLASPPPQVTLSSLSSLPSTHVPLFLQVPYGKEEVLSAVFAALSAFLPLMNQKDVSEEGQTASPELK